MDRRYCEVCKGVILSDAGAGMYTIHDCGCYSHNRCLEASYFEHYDNCPTCETEVDPQHVRAPVKQTERSEDQDYVANLPTPHYVGAIRNTVIRWLQHGQDREAADHPLYLIRKLRRQNCPVGDFLVGQKGIGLQTCIKNGVCMRDFLESGYTWPDLCEFQDFQTRPLAALVALRTRADDFRDYPQALPYADIQEVTGIGPYHMVTCFGVGFDDKKGLCSPWSGPEKWSLQTLIDWGFKQDDLHRAGLRYVEHWNALHPNEDQIVALDTRTEHLQALVPLYQQQQPIQVVPVVQAPLYQQQQSVQVVQAPSVAVPPPPPKKRVGLKKV